jgi:hypothetical protein
MGGEIVDGDVQHRSERPVVFGSDRHQLLLPRSNRVAGYSQPSGDVGLGETGHGPELGEGTWGVDQVVRVTVQHGGDLREPLGQGSVLATLPMPVRPAAHPQQLGSCLLGEASMNPPPSQLIRAK